MIKKNENRTRREILKAGLRGGLLTGFGLFSLTFGTKWLQNRGEADALPGSVPCRQCGWLTECKKPEAAETRAGVNSAELTCEESRRITDE